MACQLRGLWIFHMETEVRLLTSRRFPSVERKLQRLQGDDYVALPCDEDINVLFVSEVLTEQEDHRLPANLPEPFHEDFRHGSFHWDPEEERRTEKLWPMGPMTALMKGKIWPVVFLHKKGFYLVTAVAIMDRLDRPRRSDGGQEPGAGGNRARALDLPQVTAAFAVLEDICDFIPASLSISDVAGISELQYYIRSALPFGSPVNTNFHLLRMVRHGFPNKEDDATQRASSPAWKPYLYKGKSKLTLSIVETVNCTLYGKPEYEDECFIQGTVYCCADITGVPEVCVPISFSEKSEESQEPEISVHNCAHIVGGIKAAKEESLKISCLPPTGPFVLCRYNFRQSPVVPVRGFYQLKELSPLEFRLLLQVQIHPLVVGASGAGSWNCQVRLPFDHRGVIRSHDLKCTSGSFSLSDHGQSIIWNLNVRRPRGTLEANLLGELVFEAPQKPQRRQQQQQQQQQKREQQALQSQHLSQSPPQAPVPTKSEEEEKEKSTSKVEEFEDHPKVEELRERSAQAVDMLLKASGEDADEKQEPYRDSEMPQNFAEREGSDEQALVDDTDMASRRSSNDTGQSEIADVSAETSEFEAAASVTSGMSTTIAESNMTLRQSRRMPVREEVEQGSDSTASMGLIIAAVGAPPSAALAAAPSKESELPARMTSEPAKEAPSLSGRMPSSRDPFLVGVNCYAEVFLEVPDVVLSGIHIDPKGVTVYPTTRIYGGVAVQKEFLTGKYTIWNMAGEVRGHYSGLQFDD